MRSRYAAAAAAAAASLIALSAPAAAQNSAGDPAVVKTPPPTDTSPPPRERDTGTTTTSPPPTPSEPVERTVRVPEPIVVPVPQTVPMEPVTISPDAAYPNGFADPADPFGNEMSLSYREQESGFDWGLLGLLGLLGLIPLFRERGGSRTVYVERDEEPRRVVRRQRIDEDI